MSGSALTWTIFAIVLAIFVARLIRAIAIRDKTQITRVIVLHSFGLLFILILNFIGISLIDEW